MAAELTGEIPQDVILALAGFMSQFPTRMMENLPEDALQIVHEGLQTGQIVTSVGEIIQLQESETKKTIENPASVPLGESWQTRTYERFKMIWPDQVGPEVTLLNQIRDAAEYDESLVEDVLTILEASTDPIKTPAVLTLWWLNNREHRFIRESAEIVRRKTDDLTHIQRALREADRKMREADKPQVTPEHIARLDALKARLKPSG